MTFPFLPTSAIKPVSSLVLLVIGTAASANMYISHVAATPLPVSQKSLTILQQRIQKGEKTGHPEPLHEYINEKRMEEALCEQGKGINCPQKKIVAKNVDIDKLAYAVAVAETSNCTAGTGRSRNNCHGIFACKNGICAPKTYATTEDSFTEFKKLWLAKYGDRFPTLQDAKRYSDGPGDTWLDRVTIAYNRK